MAANEPAVPLAGTEGDVDSGTLIRVERGSLAALVDDVFNDILDNIIFDTAMSVHREEKMARAQSAIIMAEDAAEKAMSGDAAEGAPLSAAETQTPNRITVPGAYYEDGKVYLTGNPLETVKRIICPKCRRPRKLDPPIKDGDTTPDELYCSRHLIINKPGHDIWGNPFPTEGGNGNKGKKDKKEKAGLVKGQDGTNGDSTSTDPSNAPEVKPSPASFPSIKCPNCPRYLVVTRMAQHLEKCLGISGRHASREAKARMTASQTRSSATPHGSRTGTPLPGARKSPKRYLEDDDDDEDEETPKKKRKKTVKKAPEKPTVTKLKRQGPATTPKPQVDAPRYSPAKRSPPTSTSDSVSIQLNSQQDEKPSEKSLTESQGSNVEGTASPRKKGPQHGTDAGVEKSNGAGTPERKLSNAIADNSTKKKTAKAVASKPQDANLLSGTNGVTSKKRKAEEDVQGDVEKKRKPSEVHPPQAQSKKESEKKRAAGIKSPVRKSNKTELGRSKKESDIKAQAHTQTHAEDDVDKPSNDQELKVHAQIVGA
ncbi:MAG: hypothetical protein M1825_002547 [Sarcosagium campestre]|nr:MAG: hypothetical protein M1825_002547 [Sarcosagium campestre]